MKPYKRPQDRVSLRFWQLAATFTGGAAILALAGCSTLTVSAQTADDSAASPTTGRRLAQRT
ncbi:MAG: hypothetical protein WBZ04_08640, partial [Candidatus Nanopelagicales bacterium]